jgi:hypothetical protein
MAAGSAANAAAASATDFAKQIAARAWQYREYTEAWPEA